MRHSFLYTLDSCRCVSFVIQVPSSCIPSASYFRKYLWRETGYWKWQWKKETDKQWTNNR